MFLGTWAQTSYCLDKQQSIPFPKINDYTPKKIDFGFNWKWVFRNINLGNYYVIDQFNW